MVKYNRKRSKKYSRKRSKKYNRKRSKKYNRKKTRQRGGENIESKLEETKAEYLDLMKQQGLDPFYANEMKSPAEQLEKYKKRLEEAKRKAEADAQRKGASGRRGALANSVRNQIEALDASAQAEAHGPHRETALGQDFKERRRLGDPRERLAEVSLARREADARRLAQAEDEAHPWAALNRAAWRVAYDKADARRLAPAEDEAED